MTSRAPSPWTRRDLATALLIALAFTALYAASAPFRIENIDGQARFEVTWALLEKGLPAPDHPDYLRLVVVEGRRAPHVSYYGPGHSILGLAPVWAARAAFDGSHVAAEIAFSSINVFAGALAVALYFLAAVALGHSRRLAWLASLLLGSASCLWPASLTCMENPQVAVCLLALVLAILWRAAAVPRGAAEEQAGRDTAPLVLGAVALGWLLITRETDAAAALPLMLALLATGPASARARLRSLLVVGVASLPFVALYAAYNLWRYDSPLSFAGRVMAVEQSGFPVTGDFWSGLFGLTLGTQKGLLFFSPLAVVGLLGFGRLWTRSRALATAALATFVLTVLTIAPLAAWRGDWTWGPRYLFGAAPLLHLGLLEVLAMLGRDTTGSPVTRGSVRVRALGQATVLAIGVAALSVQLAAVSVFYYRFFLDQALELDYVYGLRDHDRHIRSQLGYHFEVLPEILRSTRARLDDPRKDAREPIRALDHAAAPISPSPLKKKGPSWAKRYAAFDAVPFAWVYWDLATGGQHRGALRAGLAVALILWGAGLAGAWALSRRAQSASGSSRM